VTTAGVTAGWIGESVAFTDATPTWTSGGVSVFKAGAFAFGSYEALSDADVAGELGALFADSKARLEGTAFATGTGSAQPQGIVTYASNATSLVTGTSGASGSADLVPADVYGLRSALSPRWRGNASWVGSLQIAHKIRQLGTTSNYHAFTLDLSQADPPQLLGKTFYENSSMDTTIVSGSTDDILIHGDFSQFAIVDRVGMVIQYQPIVTSGSKFPTGESAWHVYWRVGSGGLVQDAFRMLLL
jgi:HK97 family phage major capsid protein